MLKLIRRAYAVFKAYAVSELVRSKGFIYGFIGFSLWIVLFIAPMSLFVDPGHSTTDIATYGFTAILIFMFYSIATWDWAAELRWMINRGMLEYYIASGSGFLPHYLGIMPVSMIWLGAALLINYATLSLLWGPPQIVIADSLVFLAGFAMLLTVLVAYALILGGTVISSGTTGFVMEIISFILPMATGGLAPLSRLPYALRTFALATPFSYPAEAIRYSMLGLTPVMDISELLFRGYVYALAFLALAIAYFRYQLKKILREGVRATAMW